MPDSPAILWIVATPIGNLGDMSPRAAEVLSGAAVIAAEDTRHTGRLLAHLGINTPMLSLHEHNETQRTGQLIDKLLGGQAVALVSDAGTPLISDPGFTLVRRAHECAVEVRCVPGACAAIAALSIAGLATDRFVFEGFLPARAGPRRARLAELADETRTLVVYESSHRIVATAADLAVVLGGDRRVTLARELTKLHEQSVSLPAGELRAWLATDDQRRRGEFVLVIACAPPASPTPKAEIDVDALLRELLLFKGTKDAVKIAVRLTGMARNDVYARAIDLQ